MLFDLFVFENHKAPVIIVMSYPLTEVVCGFCGSTISKVINLRPI